MKVFIDRGGCISCGRCAESCPEVFHMADDGLAEVYAAPTQDTAGAAAEAAGSCPVSVIHTEE